MSKKEQTSDGKVNDYVCGEKGEKSIGYNNVPTNLRGPRRIPQFNPSKK